jgi:hypothetical protein
MYFSLLNASLFVLIEIEKKKNEKDDEERFLVAEKNQNMSYENDLYFLSLGSSASC